MSTRKRRGPKGQKTESGTRGGVAAAEAPVPPSLQSLPQEILEMVLWNYSIELADLYYIRFACRSLRAAAASVLLKRVKWIAAEEKDIYRMIQELARAGESLAERLGNAASEEWERAGLQPLAHFSAGQMLFRAGVPPDHIFAWRIFCNISAEFGGRLLCGWRAHPRDIRLLLQVAAMQPEESVYSLEEILDPRHTDDGDGAEQEKRYLDPFTVVIREIGLSPEEMLDAIPSPAYLGFRWYFRVVWELEGFPSILTWTKEMALQQLPRVKRAVQTFLPRMWEDAKDRDPAGHAFDTFASCSDEVNAAVLNALEVPWSRMWGTIEDPETEIADLVIVDIARELFGPNGYAKSGQDCAEFFLGIESDRHRGWFACSLVEDDEWPVSMPFQIWDFLPPCTPDEFDRRSGNGNGLWQFILSDASGSDTARIESYLSKLLQAAPDGWTLLMHHTLFRHFDLHAMPKTGEMPDPPKFQPARIRCVTRALGDPVDSVALVLLKKISMVPDIAFSELFQFRQNVSEQLLGHSLTKLRPDRSLRLIRELLDRSLPDGILVGTAHRLRLVALVSERR